jgi:hypothetical protein
MAELCHVHAPDCTAGRGCHHVDEVRISPQAALLRELIQQIVAYRRLVGKQKIKGRFLQTSPFNTR